MKRFIQDDDRGQSTLLPEALTTTSPLLWSPLLCGLGGCLLALQFPCWGRYSIYAVNIPCGSLHQYQALYTGAPGW